MQNTQVIDKPPNSASDATLMLTKHCAQAVNYQPNKFKKVEKPNKPTENVKLTTYQLKWNSTHKRLEGRELTNQPFKDSEGKTLKL